MKQIYAFIVIIIILLLGLIFINFNKDLMYEQNLFYMDTYINIKFFTDDEVKADKALKEVNSIFKKYHELSDRYQAYHGVNNIYYINNTSEQALQIEDELYELISYGKSWYYKSNGIKNINIGNVVDIWREYKDSGTGIPTEEELKSVDINIENVLLKENNVIEITDGLNLDLGSVAKGYATKIVGDYLKKEGIDKFLINAGGNVLVGDHYADNKYKIGIQDPIDGVSVYQIVNASNKAVVTSGGYERYFIYDSIEYNHIIDPNTLFPANKYKSVTVITDDSAKADGISLVLYVLDIDEGKEFLKQFDDVEAIWYIDENNIVKTDGFSIYE